jgi:predicted nucleic acid-binding protein
MHKHIFLDANVLIDLYDETRPFCPTSRKALLYLLSEENTELFTSCDIITTLYYVNAKKDKQKALDHIMEVNQWCTVVGFGSDEVLKSCRLMKQNKAFTDLEDTIQYVMAKKVKADLILSNDKGFASDGIELMSTEKFCMEMNL